MGRDARDIRVIMLMMEALSDSERVCCLSENFDHGCDGPIPGLLLLESAHPIRR
jgi:hypothetical protein